MTTERFASAASHAARTDVGVLRDHNEDRFLVRPPLFVVADGLGGQAAGEVAAQLLVDQLATLSEAPTGSELIRGIEAADRAISAAAAAHSDRRGMSTTCVALLFAGGQVQVAHVGDSRAYRLRAGVLTRLTEDHSVVAELVRGGLIDEAQAEVDDRRHILTQALGSDHRISVSSTSVALEAGDRFLLCSDGLSAQVAESEIEAVLRDQGDVGLAADELVRRANAAGGVDNVTVIVTDAIFAEQHVRPAAAQHIDVPRRRGVLVAVGVAGLAVVGLLGVVVAGMSPTPSPSSTSTPSVGPTPSQPDASLPVPATLEPRPSGLSGPSQAPGARGGSAAPSVDSPSVSPAP